MKQKIYEIECERNNVTPKQFYDYCKNQIKKKGGDLESWATFEDWTNETQQDEYHKCFHEDWDEPATEITQYMPYRWQTFLAGSYNFVLEFQFYTEEKGSGYLYLMEYER